MSGSEEGEVFTILYWSQDQSRAKITEDVATHTFFLEFLLFAKLLWSRSKFSVSGELKQTLEDFSRWLFHIIPWNEPLHTQHFFLDSYLRYHGTSSDPDITWIDYLVSKQFSASRSYIRNISLFLTPYHVVYSGDPRDAEVEDVEERDKRERDKKTPLSGSRELDSDTLQIFSFMGQEVDYVLNTLFLSFFLHNGPPSDQAEPQEDGDFSSTQEELKLTVTFSWIDQTQTHKKEFKINNTEKIILEKMINSCLLYTSPSPRDS